MAEFKVVIGQKDGKCAQREVKGNDAKAFIGKKIGDVIKGDDIGLAGYEFQVTGGSDNAGFPMRKDVHGIGRKKVLAVSGVGIKKKRHGQKQRKTVCGDTIHPGIIQVNLKVLKQGKEKLAAAPAKKEGDDAKKEEAPAEKPAEKKEEKPAEAPKEEKKEAPKEEKPKEEKPAEPPKEEPKPEEKK